MALGRVRRAGGREARILDAAGELLLIFGYRRVTIDDVARRAEVGKGTVYLHWSSKLELFATVLLREVARIVAEQLAAMRADPAEIRLHRTMRRTVPAGHAPAAGPRVLHRRHRAARRAARRHEDRPAVRRAEGGDGPALPRPRCTSTACWPTTRRPSPGCRTGSPRATSGFFLLERMLPAGVDLDLERKADGLAEVVRRSFEPATEPDPGELAAAAAAVIELYEHMLAELTAHCPRRASDHHRRPPRPISSRAPRTSRAARLAAPDARGAAGLAGRHRHLARVPARRRRGRHPRSGDVLLRTPAGSSRRPGRCSAGMMTAIDPPEHRALRRLVSAAFTPRTVAGLEPRIRDRHPRAAGRRGRAVRPGGRAGLPAAGDRDRRAARAADRATATCSGPGPTTCSRCRSTRRTRSSGRRSAEATAGITGYLAEHCRARRADPRTT